MKHIITFFLWIWQFPQHIGGFILSLFKSHKEKYHTSTIYYLPWKRIQFGVSLGSYIILTENISERDLDYIKQHEYGHSLQSKMLGPLYFIIIGLPSLTINRISEYKTKNNSWGDTNPSQWYYTKYPEKWANDLYQKQFGDMLLPY